MRIETRHTCDLAEAHRQGARRLLFAAFDDFAESDWEHALGGIHALGWEGDDLVAHASIVQRRLLHHGRALRAGYVEAVAVAPDRQGRGHGAAVMDAVERVARGAYDLAALGSSDRALGFYAARGWQVWKGPTSVLSPTGRVRTPDDEGAVHVMALAVPLDLSAELTCDWRDGDVW